MRSYEQYCQRRSRVPHPIRADYAADWLSSLAAAGQHKSSTLAGYKSALHTAFEQARTFDDTRANPMDHPNFRRLLEGIARAKAPQEQAARQQALHTTADPLTFDIVKQLRELHRDSDARESMLFAATALAVAGVLRPSELLGSSKLPDRALRLRQLTLLNGEGQPIRLQSSQLPAAARLHLQVSKTDQRQRGVDKEITAPTAVQALHTWLLHRQGKPEERIFELAGKPLTTYALLAHLRRQLPRIGQSSFTLTGKSFRRGGASSLALLGVPAEDIARAGWAAHSSAWQEYYAASPEVRRARQGIVNRQMELVASPSRTDRHATGSTRH